MLKTLKAAVLTASLALPLAAHAGGPSCNEFVTKVVDLTVAEQGKESMYQKKDIPEIVKGCEKAKNLPAYAGAACVMKAKTFAEMKACTPKIGSVMRDW